jgi:hypothetical protein
MLCFKNLLSEVPSRGAQFHEALIRNNIGAILHKVHSPVSNKASVLVLKVGSAGTGFLDCRASKSSNPSRD